MSQSPLELSPYLRAKLRPLMQLKLWISTGIFLLSAFVLVRMFIQPHQFLGKAGEDRGAAANQQANDNLSPEDRSIAAELDDLDVLLKELDDDGTLKAAERSLASEVDPKTQAAREKALEEALKNSSADGPDLDLSQLDYGSFESLPLLNLNPSNSESGSAIAGQPAGFVGFNSLSDNPALTLSPSTGNRSNGQSNNPLQSAIDRYSPQSLSRDPYSDRSGSVLEQAIADTTQPTTPSSNPSANSTNSSLSTSTSLGSPVNPSTGLTNPAATLTNPAVPGTGLTGNTLTGANQATIPTDNAFTQLLNPQLTLPQPSPVPVAPTNSSQLRFQVPGTATGGTSQISPGINSSLGSSQNAAQFSNQPLNQPVATPAYPQVPQSPSSNFSVPRRPPGQSIGGGQINTFSNP